MIKVSILNESTVIADEEAARVVSALEVQVGRDFSQAWGIFAELLFIPRGMPAMPGTWQLVILDDAESGGYLGYHDYSKDGLPHGNIYAKTAMDNGSSWSVTASHELLEMLGDPGINLTVFREDIGQVWAYENCDSPEADSNGYLIDGVLVSDFVFPSWFEDFWESGATQFDQQNKITRPFEILPGGYIGYLDVKSGLGWQQLTMDKSPATIRKARPPVGSRRERRRTLRSQWLRSTK